MFDLVTTYKHISFKVRSLSRINYGYREDQSSGPDSCRNPA